MWVAQAVSSGVRRAQGYPQDWHTPMMVNFTCQLDRLKGCPDTWLNFISGCVCEVLQMRSAFELGSVKQIALPTVGRHHSIP